MKTILFTRLHRRYAVNLHILYRSLLFLVAMLFVSYAAKAQSTDSGAVKITVLDKSNNEAIPFANVVAYQNGVQIAIGTTDMDGQCVIKKLAPGKYDFKAVYVGYMAQEVKGMEISAARVNWLNINLKGGDNLMVCYCYCNCYRDDTEDWWPKLWTPYREMYKEWKEKKERKLAKKAASYKPMPSEPKQNIIEEEPLEYAHATDSMHATRVAEIITREKEIKIYPNPSSGIVFIESKDPLQISILNAEGKVVRDELTQGATTELKLKDLSAGVYYLNYELNGKSESRKVVMINP